MAGQVGASPSTSSFEYELYGGDPDHPITIVSTPNTISPWIDPGVLKLRHRIGRGSFGDVWLATQHQSTEDYDEYHEVAVKMLFPIKEDQINNFLAKFEDVFSKCQEVRGVCFLHGVSTIGGKICIVMKFYEGSVGDKMAHLKGGKLLMHDFLRYGIDLAQGILELHSKGILVLNLKPFNFLLNEHDQAILGDFGIPSLLLGISLPSSDTILRLGTPNYMAPEQWQPDVRGPISFETDSWGFGCSIVEMLSGAQPWCGKSAEEIYHLVVTKQEKPNVPSGLPPVIENVVSGCFEYDFRNRPLMADILQAFKSCQNALDEDESRINLGIGNVDKSNGHGYTKWFLSKDLLQVGDTVRSRKPAKSCKPESMAIPEGTVVGLESGSDRDGFVLVRVHGIHDPLRVQSSTLERVTSGFAAGDWVRVREEDKKKHASVGILHSIERDGRVTVGLVGMEILWKGTCSDLQMAESYCVDQFVRVKANVFSPRFEWPRKRGGEWATGRICQVLPNGCLVVRFPGRFVLGDDCKFLADPAEVEVVSFNTCQGAVKKYQHLEDFHWAVRPLVIALGLFTALKVGFFIGKNVGRSRSRLTSTSRLRSRRKKGRVALVQGDIRQLDGQDGSNPAWLPPSVANILFREGVAPAR
ncbi:uncharacterized protein LOC131258338 [Magnolia sinica]|uniref:uncharacterized protein LOC131258338 n=1 Tax=Magnolia sinica TaxID=86752 RepID=UPI00265AE69E|nr:uncharacterized protein LOC131258338 [Magnolia sinica]